MLLLVATFSLMFTSCGGDDDEPKGGDISIAGQINTATIAINEGLTIDVGCQIYNYNSGNVSVDGGRIAYAGNFQSLSNVLTAPVLGTNSWNYYQRFYNGGCYIVYSNTGNFIRLKITTNQDDTFTVKFQTFLPTNL